jgi:2Fe-2S iron-sulfur cluster binding domain
MTTTSFLSLLGLLLVVMGATPDFLLPVCHAFQAIAAVTPRPASSSCGITSSRPTVPLLSIRGKSGGGSSSSSSSTALHYEPKWKKKETLADAMGPIKDLAQVGLKGDVPVVFKQGNVTKSTMAMKGQPLRDVATQAGQFIKYGCGKGECGTCEALVNGQWIRPCSTFVPADLSPGMEYVVQVKEVKSKAASSGKFYSVRSFLMGFYNNLLGMVGFVKYRRAAKKNWDERREYEELVRQRTLEKKRARQVEKITK